MGGSAAYRVTSPVSDVMLAGIGPVKPFLLKNLIAHSQACGLAKDEPPTRSPSDSVATSAASPAARRGRTRQ